MYYVEWRGQDISRFVSQAFGTTTVDKSIGERPTAGITLDIPEGETLSSLLRFLITPHDRFLITDDDRFLVTEPPSALPVDREEITIDYPGLPYRATAQRVPTQEAYWSLDERDTTVCADISGAGKHLTCSATGIDFRYREGSAAAVPYGGCLRLHGPETPARLVAEGGVDLSNSFGFCGYVRPIPEDFATKSIRMRLVELTATDYLELRPGATEWELRLHLDTLSSPAIGIGINDWRHVAVVRNFVTKKISLYVDGVSRYEGTIPSGRPAVINQTAQVSFGKVDATSATGLLDEWGFWKDEDPDDNILREAFVDLFERTWYYREFGGYIFGFKDKTWRGPLNAHIVKLPLVGYGSRLDDNFVSHEYGTGTGQSVRAVVQDVLERSDQSPFFTSNGVALEDAVTRTLYSEESAMNILRDLAEQQAAIVIVDSWREVTMTRRATIEHSDIVFDNTNIRVISRSSTPRFFANRVIVVGRGDEIPYDQYETANGSDRGWDLVQPIERLLEVTANGVMQSFDGSTPTWTVNADQQRISVVTGMPTPADGVVLKFTYITTSSIVARADNTDSQQVLGYAVTKKYQFDNIRTLDEARIRAQALLDRHDQPFEEFVLDTKSRAIIDREIRPGTSATFNFPRYNLNGTNLMIESVETILDNTSRDSHEAVRRIKATALDYQGDSSGYWRSLQQNRPPTPRPVAPTTNDPDQIIVRPTNLAELSGVPIQLGGNSQVGATSADWHTPDGANRVRVNGHLLRFPLSLSFMGRCWPDDVPIGTGEQLELRLYNFTDSVAIGSAVAITTTTEGGDRGVLGNITLPLKEFDLTWQFRLVGGLESGTVWNVQLDADVL